MPCQHFLLIFFNLFSKPLFFLGFLWVTEASVAIYRYHVIYMHHVTTSYIGSTICHHCYYIHHVIYSYHHVSPLLLYMQVLLPRPRVWSGVAMVAWCVCYICMVRVLHCACIVITSAHGGRMADLHDYRLLGICLVISSLISFFNTWIFQS